MGGGNVGLQHCAGVKDGFGNDEARQRRLRLAHVRRIRLGLSWIACRANGIDPVDGPYANFRNSEGYQKEAERALVLGMAGKWAIHPSQIEMANLVFTPTVEAVATARSQKAAYAEALEQGQGAINVEGVMVDAASIRIVQNLIDRADLIGS